jgi:hypothetical protein
MSPEEIDAIVSKSVTATLLSLGIDISDPKEIKETQLDFQHLRAWRESTEAVKRKALLTAVGFLVAGALGWVALTLKWPGATQ